MGPSGAVRGREAGRDLAAHHLLLLPEGTRAAAVEQLVVAAHPDAATHPGEGLRLGRRAVLAGPLHLDAGSAASAGVPAPWRLAWALQCAPDREGPPLLLGSGASDRDGYACAFPGGLPVRAERRALDLVLGVARRLDGAVRVAGSGVVLLPDPHAWVDVVVHGRRSLAPERALRVLAGACPELELAVGADGYALAVPLTRTAAWAAERAAVGDDGGVVEVLVGPPEDVPPALAHEGVVTTARLRWWPPDPAAAEHEHPSPGHRAQRRAAIAALDVLAAALAPALDGEPLDAAGLPLHLPRRTR